MGTPEDFKVVVQFDREAIQTRDCCVANNRRSARLAQIPVRLAALAQGRLSLRTSGLLGMTNPFLRLLSSFRCDASEDM